MKKYLKIFFAILVTMTLQYNSFAQFSPSGYANAKIFYTNTSTKVWQLPTANGTGGGVAAANFDSLNIPAGVLLYPNDFIAYRLLLGNTIKTAADSTIVLRISVAGVAADTQTYKINKTVDLQFTEMALDSALLMTYTDTIGTKTTVFRNVKPALGFQIKLSAKRGGNGAAYAKTLPFIMSDIRPFRQF